MKSILSAFCNLIFPKPEGQQWKWAEIALVMGVLVFIVVVLSLTKV